jgi:hypothetical protein
MFSGPKGWDEPVTDPDGMIEVSLLADTRPDDERMQVKLILTPHQARELGEWLTWHGKNLKRGPWTQPDVAGPVEIASAV